MRETIASKNKELETLQGYYNRLLEERNSLNSKVYQLEEVKRQVQSLELEIKSLHRKRDELEAVHAFLDLVNAPDYPTSDNMGGYTRDTFRSHALVRIAAMLALRGDK